MRCTLTKREFYAMLIRDRLPVASIALPTTELELYPSPLGIIVKARAEGDAELGQIKIFDKRRGRFVGTGLFCGDNTVRICEGVLVSTLGELSVEDVIGREFMISVGADMVISRAERIPIK